jgi:hypothetical protein
MKDEMNDKNLIMIKMSIPFKGMLNEDGFFKSTKRSTKQGQNYTFAKLYQKTYGLELGS